MKILIIVALTLCFLFAGRVDVCIDPGHGGFWPLGDPGAVNPRYGSNGPYESDFTYEIGNIMADDLYWGLGYSIYINDQD